MHPKEGRIGARPLLGSGDRGPALPRGIRCIRGLPFFRRIPLRTGTDAHEPAGQAEFEQEIGMPGWFPNRVRDVLMRPLAAGTPGAGKPTPECAPRSCPPIQLVLRPGPPKRCARSRRRDQSTQPFVNCTNFSSLCMAFPLEIPALAASVPSASVDAVPATTSAAAALRSTASR